MKLLNIFKKLVTAFCACYLGFGAVIMYGIIIIGSIVLFIFGIKILWGFIGMLF